MLEDGFYCELGVKFVVGMLFCDIVICDFILFSEVFVVFEEKVF